MNQNPQLQRPAASTKGRVPRYHDHPELRDPRRRRCFLSGINDLPPFGIPLTPSDEIRWFKALQATAFTACCYQGIHVPLTARGRQWQEQHRRLLDLLVNANLGLVYEMRRKTRFHHPDEDEMISEGIWALYQAVENFDPWRGFRFSTYACNSILRAFLLVSKRETRYHHRLARWSEQDRVTDEVWPPEQDTWVGDSAMAARLASGLVSQAKDLTPNERFVLQHRFLSDTLGRPPTLEAVGRLMKVSKECVRQIQLSALKKLRRSVERDARWKVYCA